MIAGNSPILWFLGRVEDINDPLQQGRVRVRCFSYHEEDPAKLPTDKLNWFMVALPTTSAGIHGVGQSIHGLLVGSDVFGIFADGKEAQIGVVIATIGMSNYTNFIDQGSNAGGAVPNYMQGIDPTTGKALNYTPPDSSKLINTSDSTTIGNLNTNQSQHLKAALAYSESSGDYAQVNQIGYCGRYQFGYGALQDCGLVSRACQSNSQLTGQVWTGKFGVNSRQDWLSNQNAQEQAMDQYTQMHYSQLTKAGVIAPDTPPDQVAGYLAVSHLLGVGGAINFKSGLNGHDANGTSAAKYFAMGQASVKGAS